MLNFPKEFELIKYDSDKKIISSITADYAKQFVKEQKWEAKNNVVATNAQGDTLKTEYLIWEEKEEKIYTEEFVRIISPRSDFYRNRIRIRSGYEKLENYGTKRFSVYKY